MALSISNELKNSLSITNEDKPTGQTWDDMTIPWDDAHSSWNQPGTPITKESKNTLTIANENKS